MHLILKNRENAFNNCINLTNILIPKQTKLENDVFKFVLI